MTQKLQELEKLRPATQVITIDPKAIDEEKIKTKVVPFLQQSDLVAFPTETVYGLGANALDSLAVSKIFQAKGRPSDNPLIVHISEMDQLSLLVHENAIPTKQSLVHTLCDRFWPGPLTILFAKNDKVPDNVTAGQPTVAVRMPSNEIARKIIQLSGYPLAAPSANLSGRPSPTCAEHVLFDLGRKEPPTITPDNAQHTFGQGIGVGCIVNGGECPIGVESTVIDAEHFLILRPGGVTLEQLQQVDSRFHYFAGLKRAPKDHVTVITEEEKKILEKPSTPGLKYTHYCPTANVHLFEFCQPWSQFQEKIHQFIDTLLNTDNNQKIGVLRVHKELNYTKYEGCERLVFHNIGETDRPDLVAKNLFSSFRDLDEQSIPVIVMEGISEENEGMAVMNRARKAAFQII